MNRSRAKRSPAGRRWEAGSRLGVDGTEAAEPWLTVVGVVPDLWVNGDRSRPAIYLALQQSIAGPARRGVDRWSLRRLSLVARTAGSPLALSSSVRDTVADLDPYVPVVSMLPMAEVVGGFTAQYQVYGAFYVVFGAVALVMATIGLYSVVAHSVGNRTAEIGIRMAMGADAPGILRLVLRQGAGQIASGVLAGSAIAIWLPFQVTRVLFEVEPWDPVVLVGVLAFLAATGVAACWVPARRAARVDPNEAMRSG